LSTHIRMVPLENNDCSSLYTSFTAQSLLNVRCEIKVIFHKRPLMKSSAFVQGHMGWFPDIGTVTLLVHMYVLVPNGFTRECRPWSCAKIAQRARLRERGGTRWTRISESCKFLCSNVMHVLYCTYVLSLCSGTSFYAAEQFRKGH
jgi:hypothetical protein